MLLCALCERTASILYCQSLIHVTRNFLAFSMYNKQKTAAIARNKLFALLIRQKKTNKQSEIWKLFWFLWDETSILIISFTHFFFFSLLLITGSRFVTESEKIDLNSFSKYLNIRKQWCADQTIFISRQTSFKSFIKSQESFDYLCQMYVKEELTF